MDKEKEVKEEVKEEVKDNDSKYSKSQLLASNKYSKFRDVLSALLKDKDYTIKQVDKLIEDYMKREVK